MTEPEVLNTETGKYDGKKASKSPEPDGKASTEFAYKKNEKAADSVKVSENPALQDVLEKTLIKVGSYLKEQAAQKGSRAHRVQELLDALTPEEQRAFIEESQSLSHRLAEGAKGAFIPGHRSVVKQKLMGKGNELLELGDFSEGELWGYIVLGAVTTKPKELAQLLDSEMSTQLKMLEVLATLFGLIPGEGQALKKALDQFTALAKAPASWIENVLPEIREAVREEARVEDIQDQTRGAVKEVQDAPGDKKAA